MVKKWYYHSGQYMVVKNQDLLKNKTTLNKTPLLGDI